ncbi:MAG TPA: toll/interleukin-1 receptor domain-containing protein [Thermoanaerobaculia bacterium]|nr:toll/interleukin-1 receptor domain-containing protein [Thermoanaerobaculia bacterium]
MIPLQWPYALNSQQLDAALAALAKAADEFRPSRLERWLHRAVGICATIAGVAFIAALPGLAFYNPHMLSPSLPVAVGLAGLAVGALVGPVAILLLALNLRLVLKTVRQRRLMKQLGLQDVSVSAWKVHRKRRPWIRIGADAALTTIGVVLLILGIVQWTNLWNLEPYSLYGIRRPASYFFSGVTILIWQSLQRNRERLELVAPADGLRATLKPLEKGPETGVFVPAALLEKVAVIEHAQIARERTQAVLAGASTANRGYAVEVSPPAAESKHPDVNRYAMRSSEAAAKSRKELPRETQTVLLDVLDQLTENPNAFPERMQTISRDGRIRIYCHPNPPLQITFEVLEETHTLDLLHFVAPQVQVTKPVFISYSRKDADWLVKLRKYLQPLEEKGLLRIWDDTQIKPGAQWLEEIRESLGRARVAVLLVSQNFLTSEFIREKELPELLKGAKARGCQVFWIAVTHSTVKDSEIWQVHAANDPAKPLASLSESDQDLALVEIYDRMKQAVSAV